MLCVARRFARNRLASSCLLPSSRSHSSPRVTPDVLKPSDEYQMCRNLFPVGPTGDLVVVSRAGLDYEQAKDLFPERFNLNNLASILTSWKTAPTSPPLTTDLFPDFDQKTKYYFYEHDRLLYRSTLWGVQWAEKTDGD